MIDEKTEKGIKHYLDEARAEIERHRDYLNIMMDNIFNLLPEKLKTQLLGDISNWLEKEYKVYKKHFKISECYFTCSYGKLRGRNGFFDAVKELIEMTKK